MERGDVRIVDGTLARTGTQPTVCDGRGWKLQSLNDATADDKAGGGAGNDTAGGGGGSEHGDCFGAFFLDVLCVCSPSPSLSS